MKILALSVEGIRNLATQQLVPRDRFNVFIGDNGQGKTNLLEAIYATATLRSFRTARLADLIAFGRNDARLSTRVDKDGLERKYEVELTVGGRRARIDGKAVRPLSRYFGRFNVVVFTPEDLALARDTPAERRRFLDRSVFTFDVGHLVAAADYEKVLKSRNAVLRAAAGKLTHSADALLDVYDEQLAGLAVTLIAARARYLALLTPEFRAAFAAITRTARVAGTSYASDLLEATASDIQRSLRNQRARDLVLQRTSIGPHRDDLAFELDGQPAGAFASQGQLRAMMLAWKSAELVILGRTQGDLPILLLDDVSSELDAARNEFLFEHLARLAGQAFITTTDARHVLVGENRADFRVSGGLIT